MCVYILILSKTDVELLQFSAHTEGTQMHKAAHERNQAHHHLSGFVFKRFCVIVVR